MLKFYILVSRNLKKVRRHLKYLDKNEVVFVINTLDKQFEKAKSAKSDSSRSDSVKPSDKYLEDAEKLARVGGC